VCEIPIFHLYVCSAHNSRMKGNTAKGNTASLWPSSSSYPFARDIKVLWTPPFISAENPLSEPTWTGELNLEKIAGSAAANSIMSGGEKDKDDDDDDYDDDEWEDEDDYEDEEEDWLDDDDDDDEYDDDYYDDQVRNGSTSSICRQRKHGLSFRTPIGGAMRGLGWVCVSSGASSWCW